MLGVRLEPELELRLNLLAKKTRRSKSFLAKEALRDYMAGISQADFSSAFIP